MDHSQNTIGENLIFNFQKPEKLTLTETWPI